MAEEHEGLQHTGQQLAKREERPLVKAGFTFLPQSWEQLYAFAKEIAASDFAPKSMQGKPGAVLAAWQKGSEVGLPPMASLESIAIINGRPSIHSSGYWALITGHPLCEWFTEAPPDVALKQGFGECTVKRRGNPHPIVRRFSLEEAKTAKLLDKDNWKLYPGDMLQNRARHRAGDDAIPEAAQGLIPADIARDLEPRDVTPPMQIPEPTKPDAGVKRPAEERKAKPPATLKEREEWVKAAPLALLELQNNFAFEQLDALNQEDQATICRLVTDRRKELQKEEKKDA